MSHIPYLFFCDCVCMKSIWAFQNLNFCHQVKNYWHSRKICDHKENMEDTVDGENNFIMQKAISFKCRYIQHITLNIYMPMLPDVVCETYLTWTHVFLIRCFVDSWLNNDIWPLKLFFPRCNARAYFLFDKKKSLKTRFRELYFL
jgi:hypothetical protein